ncbi:MAG TPA: hypothetical protein DD727_01325, partial [Clostridiales bacterium]|nr:hypothetical protein [Clostridiales bacterium]
MSTAKTHAVKKSIINKNLLQKLMKNDIISLFNRILSSPKLHTRTRSWAWIITRTIFVLGFCFIILYPVLIMISKAFMDFVDIYDNTVLLVPKHFTLMNIYLAGKMINYPVALRNSMVLAIGVT